MILGKYNQAKTVYFDLFQVDGVDFEPAATFATGDIKIMKDEGAEANTTNLPTDEGQGYSLVLTATEMSAARIKIYIVDSATKAWLDTSIYIETYGNASAEHALDLDDAVRGGMTALPNAAADAAGGLAISDAGGLDLDTLLGYLTASVATASALTTAQNDLDTITGPNGVLIDDTESAALVDEVWNEPIAGHLTAGSTGLSEALGGAAIIDTTITGTPTTTTFQLTAGSTVDDFYNDQTAYVLSGTGIGQSRVVLDYVGATKTVTIDEPFAVTPIATDRIVILIEHVHPITQIAHQIWDDDITAHSTAGSAGKAVQDIEADTNELQTDLANGGRLDLILDELTANLDTNEAKIDVMDALVDAIKAKTDSLTFTKANELDSNTQSINGVTITGDGSITPFDV